MTHSIRLRRQRPLPVDMTASSRQLVSVTIWSERGLTLQPDFTTGNRYRTEQDGRPAGWEQKAAVMLYA
jgi:hypothetical protein